MKNQINTFKEIFKEWKIIRAIKKGELNFAIQFIRDVQNWREGEKDTKCEVLARLNLDGEKINPEELIRILKKKNKYHYLTRTIIQKSFKYMDQHKEIKEFSINLNMSDIHNQQTIYYLTQQIENYNLGQRLVIELTEDEELTKEIELTKSVLKSLRSFGCKIALDDFGKGYATFDPLVNLKFDYIKLDKVLTENFLSNQHKFYIINLLSEYAKRLNMQIVAEFIEDDEEYKSIKYIDIDYAQGWGIHKETLIVN